MSEQILKEILTEMKSMKTEMKSMKTEISTIQQNMATKDELAKVSQAVARIEHDHGNKISALFDGYTLRGDQIERFQDHLDERLDAIQTDLSYILGKVAQHDRNIVRLNKIAK